MRRRRKSEAGMKSNVIFIIASRWMLPLLTSSIKRQCHWHGKKNPSEAQMVFFKKDNIRHGDFATPAGRRTFPAFPSPLTACLSSHGSTWKCGKALSFRNVHFTQKTRNCAFHSFYLFFFFIFSSWKELQLWISSRVVFRVRGVCHIGQNLGKDTSVVWTSAKG